MANSYNSNPIILDTDTASGWRGLQTLNAGNLPSTAQQNSGAVTRQWGIQVTKIQVVSAGVTAAATVSVVDPNDSTTLFTYGVAAAAGAAGTLLMNQDLTTAMKWRDFKVTGLTTGVVKLYIWYRS